MPEEVLVPEVGVEKSVSIETGTGSGVRSEIKPEANPEKMRDQSAEQYAKILSRVSTTTASDDTQVAEDVVALGEFAVSAEATITRLVSLAETKGVVHAVAVAKKLGDYYVLDVMHDELADKLYEALLAKGLVQTEV